jgi:nicotinamide-nucleotide amidase
MYDIAAVNHIKEILLKRNETLSIAESVTSGHLQAAVSLATLATEFYQGGLTAYNLAQKTKILNIEPEHADACNCVSEKVAAEMAIGVSKLFQSDWSIAITGYAAPVPELGVKELFAYWAIAYRGEVKKSIVIRGEKGDALIVQLAYANSVLGGFLQLLQSLKQ